MLITATLRTGPTPVPSRMTNLDVVGGSSAAKWTHPAELDPTDERAEEALDDGVGEAGIVQRVGGRDVRSGKQPGWRYTSQPCPQLRDGARQPSEASADDGNWCVWSAHVASRAHRADSRSG